MSTSDAWRRVAGTFGLALGLLGLCSAGLGAYAPHHFVSAQVLATAVAAGPGCVVITGDSRIAAALSPEQLRAALARGGADACVANLSLGGTGLPTEVMAVRAYLAQAPHARAVVLASVPESLVEVGPEDPASWVGNLAATFVWSRPGDEPQLLEWPPLQPLAVDRWLRFEVQRRLSLGSYVSLLWGRVQQAQDLLTGPKQGPRNQFGALADMHVLADRFIALGPRALAQEEQPGGATFSPWLAELEQQAAAQGLPLWFVELPMPALYERTVVQTAAGARLRARLRARLEAEGGHWVDLSQPGWAEERLFEDGLHLGLEGQGRLSADLGARLAPLLRALAPAAP